MITTDAQHINFPLQQLLERLKRQAGFEFTPADILRTQRLLQEKATLLLTPEGRVDLQYFLAPLLCKNQAEQQQFYQIYQEYLTIDLVAERAVSTNNNSWKLIIEYFLVSLCFLTLCWEWHSQLTAVAKVFPNIQFIYPQEKMIVGDTLAITNTSNLINDPTIVFRWDYIDVVSGQIVAQQTTRDFNFIIPNPQKNYHKKIRLNAIDTITQQIVGRDSTTILIGCQNPPQVGAISVLDTLLVPFHPLSFKVTVENKEGVTYEWEFGDGGGKKFVASPTHIYQQSGYYQLKVTVTDTLAIGGECTQQVQTEIEIQGAQKQAYIPLLTFDLLKEPPLISNPIKNWALFLFFMLLAIALWAWYKWWNRPFPEQIPRNNFIVSKPKKAVDLLKKEIQPTELQFNLANQLRLRQAGTQQIVDVIPTVHQTIEKGGFPDVQFKYKKQPTEYLVLLPQLTETTIAVQLFAYLVTFFQEQDVLIELFYYQNDWEKVWNEAHPDGMMLEKLYQHFPQHRLILYLPNMTDRTVSDIVYNRLLKEKTLQNWAKKVALQAPSVYSLRSNILPIYPANLVGIQTAIYHLNQSATTEITSTLNALKKSVTFPEKVLSITDYKTRLADRPDIFRWFKALVIHPQPTINSMIAVGEALKLPLDYDALLILSSLPNFQEGKFDLTLWSSIWKTFSTTEERQVRMALKASLMTQVEASTRKTVNPLNKLIAIQNFGINPRGLDHQEQIRYLLKKQQFSDIQLEELDLIVIRHIDNYRPGQTIGETITNYLTDIEEVKPTENRPWSTVYFWLATILSVLGLTWGGMLYCLPNGIHRMTIEQPKNEAAKWNNRGVDQYTLPEQDTVSQTVLTTNYQGFSEVSSNTGYYLEQSRRADTTFEKAITNFQKLQYNDGVAYYEQFFKEQGEQLHLAKRQFKLVVADTVFTQDSVRLAAFFALAKIYDLLNEPDSICAMIATLTQASDLTFLGNADFLSQQIDYCATNPTKIYIIGKVVDAINNRPLKNVSISGANFQTLSNQNGLFQGAIILSKTEKEITLNFNLAKYQTIRQTFPITSDSLKLKQISLALLPPEPIVSTAKNRFSTTLRTFEFPLPEMVVVPGGNFIMGCTDVPNDYCKPDEGPAHEVFLDSFEIGIYEVTNEEFAAFINDYGINEIKEGKDAGRKLTTPSAQGFYQKEDKTWAPNKGYEKHPIISVAWASAVAYCRWLSQKTGQIWRLPTEAEWEYAAKGGQKGKANNYLYAGGNDLGEVAWYYLNSAQKGGPNPNYGTNRVGQKKPNALGIYDMSGNVFEWCADWYQLDFYGQTKGEKARNPFCQRPGERRILRGGSWHLYGEQDCRVSNRFAVKYPTGGIETGFRCVRVLSADD